MSVFSSQVYLFSFGERFFRSQTVPMTVTAIADLEITTEFWGVFYRCALQNDT